MGKVITSVSEFYKDINPSTLSGAIDILVVEDVKTGQLSCSPFHVRFGKLQLLRPQEKVVEMRVNGQKTDVHMKVGEAGETFFVLPSKSRVDEEYMTSPLVTALDGRQVEPLRLSAPGTGIRAADSEGEDVKSLPGETEKLVLSDDNDFDGTREEVSDNRGKGRDLLDGDASPTIPIALPLSSSSPPCSSDPTATTMASSSPKYSWMWGGLPKKTDNHAKKEMHTEKTDTKIIATTKNGNDTVVAAAAAAAADLGRIDVLEYINRPATFKTNYDLFSAIPPEEKVNVEVFRLSGEELSLSSSPPSSPSLGEEALERDLLELLDSKIGSATEKLEWTLLADDPSTALNELSEKSILILNAKIFLPGLVGYTLLVGRALSGKPMSYEAIIKKYPILDEQKGKNEQRPSNSDGGGNSNGSGGSWRWWSRPTPHTLESSESPTLLREDAAETALSTSAPLANNFPLLQEAINTPLPPSPASLPLDAQVYYTKSLRLPHEMLEKLDLQPGVNSISFTVTTKLQGTATCTARIFRWRSDARIVVSDIDGTITKSDALGHLFAFVGKDWTHANIAKLYTNIARNGYNFVYLSSRSLGQANVTRVYLKAIEQNKFQLPDGPVIMSPDRLMAALRREMVLGIPQEFKIACLKDLQQLFQQTCSRINRIDDYEDNCDRVSLSPSWPINPFYAGFGNRTNDVHAYLAIGIPPPRVFIINPSGTVSVEPLADRYASSYAQLIELVDSIFPPLRKDDPAMVAAEEGFSEFWFWKRPISLAPLVEVEGGESAVVPKEGEPLREGFEEGEGEGEDEYEYEDEEGLIPAYYV